MLPKKLQTQEKALVKIDEKFLKSKKTKFIVITSEATVSELDDLKWPKCNCCFGEGYRFLCEAGSERGYPIILLTSCHAKVQLSAG